MGLEKKAAYADSKTNGNLVDALTNILAISSFARAAEERARFDKLTEERMRTQQWADNIGGLVNRLQGLLVVSLELMVFSVLIAEWKSGGIKWIELVFYQTYLVMVIIQLWEVAGAMNKTFKHLGDAEEMADMYAEEPEVRDAPGAYALRVGDGGIVFDSVDFDYGSGGKRSMAVSCATLVIKPGEKVAVVGPSGAGKSTLIGKLLMRFYDPNSGDIRINGQSIADVTQDSLHSVITLVPQIPLLFGRTIEENILIGRPDASREEVIDAAKKARLWEYICDLEYGLNTMVGERGVTLSGGECQRIAIARAFLADRPILVLDEATSNQDGETEAMIQKAIFDLMEDRTSIIIAHRLSTIKHADRIVVMDKGKIVEIGTHDELVAKKGLYYRLWNRQTDGYLGTAV